VIVANVAAGVEVADGVAAAEVAKAVRQLRGTAANVAIASNAKVIVARGSAAVSEWKGHDRREILTRVMKRIAKYLSRPRRRRRRRWSAKRRRPCRYGKSRPSQHR